MIEIEEIIAANGIAMLLMLYLLFCRRKNRESVRQKDKIYDMMAVITLLGAFVETVSFLVDGQDMPAGRLLNILSNGLCFAATVTIGLLWCLYVDLHVYQNPRKTRQDGKLLIIPWALEMIALVVNCFDTGILFTVSADNIYQRQSGVVGGYCTLVIYFLCSIYFVFGARNRKLRFRFFPVLDFVIPCFTGVILHFIFYGITASFVSVAIALVFVQLQMYAETVYIDELSGLFNRRYFNGVLAKQESAARGSLYGIMMDVNDLKSINDTYGHNAGDRAIRSLGDILQNSMPNDGMAIRYSGDEFVALLPDVDDAGARAVMDTVSGNLDRFSRSGTEPFTLSVSMGCAGFAPDDTAETFQRKIDEAMYENKRLYHAKKRENR